MPPKIFEFPEISFPHSEHFIKRFTRDVVPPYHEFVWDFTAQGGDEESLLMWDTNIVKSLPEELFLFDIGEQKVIDMSEEGICKIQSGQSAAFKVYYGMSREKIRPSKIILGKPYPNPFTNHSEIDFTLPENSSGSYAVTLEVYDLMGRKMATLARGQYTSGFYTGAWTPDPSAVNSSIYLFRLSVSDRKSNVVLTEKILTKN